MNKEILGIWTAKVTTLIQSPLSLHRFNVETSHNFIRNRTNSSHSNKEDTYKIL